jgi:hypothetical protein
MGAYAGPELADDGLVLALDAANTRSYGGSGTTWTDISYRGNNGTLTNGPTFEPGGPFAGSTGGSVYFDGTGDYLRVASNAALGYGTGDFTIEGWFYLTGTTGQGVAQGEQGIIGSNTVMASRFTVRIQGNPKKMSWWLNGSSNNVVGTTSIQQNTWYHFALVRSGSSTNNVKLYLNGVLESQGTSTYDVPADDHVIGRVYTDLDSEYWNGYISNLRIVKGTALYTANFTPPTSPLTAITNTSLLTCQKGSIRDASSNNFAITVNGNARSVYGFPAFKFDATDDYVQVPSTSNVQFGAENFTIECWINSSSLSSQYYAIVGQRTGDTLSTIGWSLYIDTSKVGINFSNGSSSLINTNNTTLSIGTWYHVAAVRNGSNLIVYVNGVGSTATSVSGSVVLTGSVLTIGGGFGSSIIGVYNGYISNTRVYKGKGLTAAEVLQNYQNTKSRYGL